MNEIDRRLEDREKEGSPIRVALIGAAELKADSGFALG
jgi:predicted homoserine dehydrogenase-like protein